MHPAITFLVLDDNEDMLFLHRRELEREFPGCVVIECEASHPALERAQDLHLDAVITDHSLCGESGSAFIAKLRANGVGCHRGYRQQ